MMSSDDSMSDEDKNDDEAKRDKERDHYLATLMSGGSAPEQPPLNSSTLSPPMTLKLRPDSNGYCV